MQGHYFVSYSRADGSRFALSLADRLEAGPPSYPMWVDARRLNPGEDWDHQISDAIQTCEGLIFVMSADSVHEQSECKREWELALQYKKPIIPIRLTAGVTVPYRLSSRQFIDFSEDFTAGLARLRIHLERAHGPEGRLDQLRARLRDAERELPRADDAQKARVQADIDELERSIEEQRRFLEDPEAVSAQTRVRIAAELEQERRPERSSAAAPRTRFVNPPPMTAPVYFQDRHLETEIVGQFLGGNERIIAVIGRGGTGKTAMVCRLLKSLEQGRLPDDLGELDVDGVVYLSPAGAHPVNFPNLFGDLCRLLSEDAAEPLRAAYRDPHQTPAALMRSLLEAFPDGRYVVMLDNFEDLLDAETFGLTDAALDEALQMVVTAPAHGVKVVITSRLAPRSLILLQPGVARRLDLDEGLPVEEAAYVLRARDPNGTLGLRDASPELLAEAQQRTRGFPRALEALAAILAVDRASTLPDLLADASVLPENVVEVLVGEAFTRLDPLAQQVMQALAVFPLPVPAVAVDVLLQRFEPAINSAPVLNRLVNMQFVRRDSERYHLHQVDRDYAAERIPAGAPGDDEQKPLPWTRHALYALAADYFLTIRTPPETWKTLDDLVPQLAEFEMRFAAGDYNGAARLLGDIGPDHLQAWGHYRLNTELTYRVRPHMTDGLEAAMCDLALGDCLVMLGNYSVAIAHYEDAERWFHGTGEDVLEALALLGAAGIREIVGEREQAIAEHERALAIAEQHDNRTLRRAALYGLASCHLHVDPGTAGSLYEEARALAHELGEADSEVMSLTGLGHALAGIGHTRTALAAYDEGLQIAQRGGSVANVVMLLAGAASRYGELGEFTTAVECTEKALGFARSIGDPRAEALLLGNLGELLSDLGEYERGVVSCQESVTIGDGFRVAQVSSGARLQLARIHLMRGDCAAALDAVQAARTHGVPGDRRELSLLLGVALIRLQRIDDAREAFRETVREADSSLERAARNYRAADHKAIALAGLVASGDDDLADEAQDALVAAQAITDSAGIRLRRRQLVELVTANKTGARFDRIRAAAIGDSGAGELPRAAG